MRTLIKLTVLLFCVSTRLQAQEPEVDRLIQNEFKMTFPSIYFKHQSSEYATMPYTADSCFKHLAMHFKDEVSSLVMWRDSAETEELTLKRIGKIKRALAKYVDAEPDIHSMGAQQKISRETMRKTSDKLNKEYLLSLNSVLDLSKTRFPKDGPTRALAHVLRPKIWCFKCWRSGFHMDRKSRGLRKLERQRKQKQKAK